MRVKQRIEIRATDPKHGMTPEEMIEAIQGVPGETEVRVLTTLRGKVKSVTLIYR